MAKYRMLFLHGMPCCPRMYKDKLLVQFLATLERANWEVVFVQSPRVCQDVDPPPILKEWFPDVQPHEMCEWVNSQSRKKRDNDDDGSTDKEYLGLQESLSFLQSYLNEQPRFDVIAGHSNGALMASILSFYMDHNIQVNNNNNWDKPCRGILCMNAPNSYETEMTLGPLVAQHGPVTQIPSLHVWGGKSDHTYEGSQKLKRVHHHPTSSGPAIEHEAGHFFPQEQHYYDDICQALQEMMKSSEEGANWIQVGVDFMSLLRQVVLLN